MPTAIYKNASNEQVPSVTTINRIGQESGGLIHWAWELGTRGLDYREIRNTAARAGNIGHALVEAAVKCLPAPSLPTDGAAKMGGKAFDAYLRTVEIFRLRWTDSELALVSEEYQFGGTIDLIGVEEGRNVYSLGDVKTGAIYPHHLCQIAAYGKLFEECTGHAIGNYHLFRFNRETGDFIHCYFDNLDDAWQAFLTKRKLYDQLKPLKKRV